MTDKDWCLEHAIHPGKFYYHIRRLRAKSCKITERDCSHTPVKDKQEVVAVSFSEQPLSLKYSETASPLVSSSQSPMSAVIRLNIRGIQLEISNQAERDTIANTLFVLQSLC